MQSPPKSVPPIPKKKIVDLLWNSRGSLTILLLATAALLFILLGAKDLWTQEWRWAEISRQMLLRHDFFHPYLANENYYDKPLLSYWFMVGLSILFGKITTWAIRLPSAIAGFVAVLCTYYLGARLSSKKTGLIAGWMLVTTYFFVFWARIGNADMLNLAGILIAVAWYFKNPNQTSFFNYSVFFIILAISALFKGLIAPAMVFIALLPDLLYQHHWKKHCHLKLFIALLPALLVYLSPFIASFLLTNSAYKENGLYLVFKENILRYFQPFDHQEPFYHYFLYFPEYTLPWILFFIPALCTFPIRWRTMVPARRWLFWATGFVFIFLIFSGSRRDYYILPTVPFALLFTADWISHRMPPKNMIYTLAGKTAITVYLLLLIFFTLIVPYAYSGGGPKSFARLIKTQATAIAPWENWHVHLIGTQSHLTYYLQSPNAVDIIKPDKELKAHLSQEILLNRFPLLTQHKPDTLIIIGKNLFNLIQNAVADHYIVIEMPLNRQHRILHNQPADSPIALIPKSFPNNVPSMASEPATEPASIQSRDASEASSEASSQALTAPIPSMTAQEAPSSPAITSPSTPHP